MSTEGIDIASFQGRPNFAQVKAAGYEFVITKATEGVSYVNPEFAPNWPAIKAAGLLRGAYHFADPDNSAAPREALYFLNHVAPLEAGDVLALDLEKGTGNLLQWALDFIATVEDAVGFTPLFYSGRWFMDPHGLTGSTELARCGLWLAAYQATEPDPPPDWTFNAIWQHSDSGSVPGVSGPCDLDRFNGTADQFRLYGKPAAVSKPHMTNNDLAQHLRILMANDTLNPEAAATNLQQFRD